jgi:hypothetical protein
MGKLDLNTEVGSQSKKKLVQTYCADSLGLTLTGRKVLMILYTEINKEMASLYVRLKVFCLFEAGVLRTGHTNLSP